MTARNRYQGTFRKVVIAFDVGTTFSGASYAILDPGLVPEVRGVTRCARVPRCRVTTNSLSTLLGFLHNKKSVATQRFLV